MPNLSNILDFGQSRTMISDIYSLYSLAPCIGWCLWCQYVAPFNAGKITDNDDVF